MNTLIVPSNFDIAMGVDKIRVVRKKMKPKFLQIESFDRMPVELCPCMLKIFTVQVQGKEIEIGRTIALESDQVTWVYTDYIGESIAYGMHKKGIK